MIRIVAFETREDEISKFKELADQFEVEIICRPEVLTGESLAGITGASGISVLGQSLVDREIMAQLKRQKINFISTRTVGYNHIDLRAANEFGIRVSNAYYDPNGVADYTVMLILMSLRKYKQALWRANVNDYSLKGLQGREMRKLTVGIVGTGRIGAQVIENLSGFGCRLIAFDTRINETIKDRVQYLSLDELYAEADIISYHVPLLESTHQMVRRETLAKMKNGVILINCSRGELMNFSDITDGIESHKIGAMAHSRQPKSITSRLCVCSCFYPRSF